MGKFQLSHIRLSNTNCQFYVVQQLQLKISELVNEIAMLMGYEVSRDLPLEDVEIETPITNTQKQRLVKTCNCPYFTCWYRYG